MLPFEWLRSIFVFFISHEYLSQLGLRLRLAEVVFFATVPLYVMSTPYFDS
jgi:hypothetical protein